MLESYRQHHYKKGLFSQLVLKNLAFPVTSKDLSHKLERSSSRVSQVLIRLERSKRAQKFKVRSTYFWFRPGNDMVLISIQKGKILKLLDRPRRVFEIADAVHRTWKSVFRRLNELEHLGLVRQTKVGWFRVRSRRKVVAI